jgi:hypothetical protein
MDKLDFEYSIAFSKFPEHLVSTVEKPFLRACVSEAMANAPNQIRKLD